MKFEDLGLNDWRILGLTTANQPVPFKKIQEMLDMDKGQLVGLLKCWLIVVTFLWSHQK